MEELHASQAALSRSEEDHKAYQVKAQKILAAKEAQIMSNQEDPSLAEAELLQIM